MAEPKENTYDLVPYESHPFAHTHCDRLQVIAKLVGLNAAPSSRCRVLELGCAAGGNLIPMAYALPESEFVGVDLSSVQVSEGQGTVQKLGLKNIELKRLSILDVGPEFGTFDYIVCHGVYSWVPPPCQEKILQICKNNLKPHGVAYVSYNTYPGWHMRGMIRDMLFYHARQFVEPAMRIKQARNLLDFLARAVAGPSPPTPLPGGERGESAHTRGARGGENAYSLLLRQELESVQRSSDSYLFHEHLEETNEPVYFYQFAERAAKAGLRYLAEVDLRVMVPANYPPEIANVLHMLAQDHIHLEQYMDFLRNRMFRQTLLCHANVQPNYSLRWQQLREFHVASPARVAPSPPTPLPRSTEGEGRTARDAGPSPPAPLPGGERGESTRSLLGGERGEPLHFETPDGVTLQARDPIVKAAMLVLQEAWPRAVRFGELLKEARGRLEGAEAIARDTGPSPPTPLPGGERGEGAAPVLGGERAGEPRSGEEKGEAEEEQLGQALLQFYAQASTSLVELWLHPPRFTVEVSARPRASALARLQAETKGRVTSLRHESVFLGDFERRLLQLLDGARSRDALVDELVRLARAGELTVEKDGRAAEGDHLPMVVAEAVENRLERFARAALLEG